MLKELPGAVVARLASHACDLRDIAKLQCTSRWGREVLCPPLLFHKLDIREQAVESCATALDFASRLVLRHIDQLHPNYTEDITRRMWFRQVADVVYSTPGVRDLDIRFRYHSDFETTTTLDRVQDVSIIVSEASHQIDVEILLPRDVAETWGVLAVSLQLLLPEAEHMLLTKITVATATDAKCPGDLELSYAGDDDENAEEVVAGFAQGEHGMVCKIDIEKFAYSADDLVDQFVRPMALVSRAKQRLFPNLDSPRFYGYTVVSWGWSSGMVKQLIAALEVNGVAAQMRRV